MITLNVALLGTFQELWEGNHEGTDGSDTSALGAALKIASSKRVRAAMRTSILDTPLAALKSALKQGGVANRDLRDTSSLRLPSYLP